MISDHLKPRPVQRNKIFQQKKKVVKRTSLFMQCSKVRAEIAATAERNGRKCRHVYVVINPDLQAQDQPKGKQKKRKKWKFIQSAIVFFFLSVCYHYCDSDRSSSRCQTNIFFFRAFPVSNQDTFSAQRATKHERRRCLSAFEQTWDASWWSAHFFEHITFLFVCFRFFFFFFWKII